MSSKWTMLWIVCGLFLAACAPATTPIPPTVTPSPAPAKKAPELVTFTTPDGASLQGTLYGVGETAVIFSVMGDCKRGWEEMADLVSQYNIMTLTYQWRACTAYGTIIENDLPKFVDDLRGAINFMRQQGAKKIILAGASLGGVASAKLAVETSPNGLIIVAAPREIEDWNFEIGLGDVNIDMPKLFITAENDSVVSPERSRELFDLLAEPKEWQTYPGTAHGTDLFETENKKALQERILDFVLSVSSMIPPN